MVEAVLENTNHRVHILNYGNVMRRWFIRSGRDGNGRDIVLGFDRFDDYPIHSRSFGILAGRVANRTRHGRFELLGQKHQLSINHGPHHLHGGTTGLGERVWDLDPDTAQNRIRLRYFSPHNEEGYPANVQFTVTWSLTDDGLHCVMEGLPDAPTPINLAQHNYYNLNAWTGNESAADCEVRSHALQIDAAQFLPVDNELIPTGKREPVANTRFDFRQLSCIAQQDPARQGHDHTLILREDRDPAKPAAQLVSADGSTRLSVVTSEPGMQLYTAAALSSVQPGIAGRPIVPFGGICLEAQHFPDSLNRPGFPSIICTPDKPYRQTLTLHAWQH